MARSTTKARGGKSTKAAPKAKAAQNGGGRRTHADRAKRVPEIVKMIKSGAKLGDVRAKFGPISALLAEAGYNTKGEKVSREPINGSGATLAKRVAAQRRQGVPFYELALRTSKSQAELVELLETHGFADVARGRVKTAPQAEAKTRSTKAAPKAKAAPAKAKAATKRGKTQETAEARTPRRPGRRVGKKRAAANPS